MARQTGVRINRCGIPSPQGELTLLVDPRSEAEAEGCFRSAIDIARQAARPFELGVTTSLARLLASQGRHDEARTMLAEIYNWFTTGFDIADLKDAKALDELNIYRPWGLDTLSEMQK